MDNPSRAKNALQKLFKAKVDPWNYQNEWNQERYRREGEMLDAVSNGELFSSALEIGCAEGLFTEKLAPRCRSLISVDTSGVALDRARQRTVGYPHVRFAQWDLLRDPPPGQFDLVVAVHVLDCYRGRRILRTARAKLVDCLKSGGYLLMGSVHRPGVSGRTWWDRYLVRGGQALNAFISLHGLLTFVSESRSDLGIGDQLSLDTLFRKSIK